MIIADKLQLFFGAQAVFDDVSFTVSEDQRVGLVGRNGSGKSTLLHAFFNPSILDGGKISIPKNKKIAYLPQEVVLESERSILDETVRAFEGVAAALDLAADLEQKLATNPNDETLAADFAAAQLHLVELNLDYLQAQAKKMLDGLGFKPAQLIEAVSTLSVGWKMRIVLAKLLLQDADFYLFDEPTNHLDIIAKEWFLEFLKEASFGFMIVCHERYFLDELCNHILDLDRGTGTMYTGDYSSYMTQKEHNLVLLHSAAEQQQKEIARKQATIDRFKAKASKAKMAQSMMKALDKIEIIELPPKPRDIRFNMTNIKPSGRIVLEVKNVGYKFGDKQIFDHASFIIERGWKVAIVAANGVGKTTLLHIITGQLPKQNGAIDFGYNVDIALFAQDQNKMLDKKLTVIDNVNKLCPSKTEQAVRSMLGAFLFGSADIQKKVGVLSGGEKNRVGMVSTLLHDANFLLLDEPTNHLDIPSKEILMTALQQYTGTILFVSHDRDFVNNLATHIIELTPTSAHIYEGDFDAFKYQKEFSNPHENSAQEGESASSDAQTGGENKERYALRKESARLERMTEKFEKEIANVELGFGEHEWGTPEFEATEKKVAELRESLKKITTQWEEIQKKLA